MCSSYWNSFPPSWNFFHKLVFTKHRTSFFYIFKQQRHHVATLGPNSPSLPTLNVPQGDINPVLPSLTINSFKNHLANGSQIPRLRTGTVLRVSNTILSKGSSRDQLFTRHSLFRAETSPEATKQSSFDKSLKHDWGWIHSTVYEWIIHSFIIHSSSSFIHHSASPPPCRDSLFCAPVAPGKASVKFITDGWWPMQDSSSTKLSAPEGRWRSICLLPSLQPLPVARRCSSIDSTGIYWAPTVYQALLEVLWILQ